MTDLPVGQMMVPLTGEIVALNNPTDCVRAMQSIREIEGKLREAKKELTFYLLQEFKTQGTKTIHVGDLRAEMKGGTEFAWDMEILDELRDAGLPEDRFNDLVKTEVSYKVSAAEAKKLSGANPIYKEIIDRAKTSYEKEQYVSIRRG